MSMCLFFGFILKRIERQLFRQSNPPIYLKFKVFITSIFLIIFILFCNLIFILVTVFFFNLLSVCHTWVLTGGHTCVSLDEVSSGVLLSLMLLYLFYDLLLTVEILIHQG